jgi:hypothetical protein
MHSAQILHSFDEGKAERENGRKMRPRRGDESIPDRVSSRGMFPFQHPADKKDPVYFWFFARRS